MVEHRVREALRVVPLQKKPEQAERQEAHFLDLGNVREAFQEAVKSALPGIYGNESTGPQEIVRTKTSLLAFPDGDDDEAHCVALKTSQDRHWVEITFTSYPYDPEGHIETSGKSSSKKNDDFPADGAKYLASLIDDVYSKMEPVIAKIYDGLSDPGYSEDKFFEYKNLGRKSSLKASDLEAGDSVRYTYLDADPEFGPDLYDELRKKLGKIARVVYVGYPSPGSITARFKDGFTFELYPDEVEASSGIPT